MRWRNQRRSRNVETRRGGGGRSGLGGLGSILGGGRRGGKMGGMGIVGIIVLFLIGHFTGIDVMGLLGGGGTSQSVYESNKPLSAEEKEQVEFVSAVLGSTEDVWGQIYAAQGKEYKPTTLVDYRNRTGTACGQGNAAMGPFYCPADRKIYLDQTFFVQLARKYGAPGDFARAYVIAHEVGHHLQTLDGTSTRNQAKRARVSKREANFLSVQLELQADCYAGVWAHYANRDAQMLEPGDLEEGLAAAKAVGDDALGHSDASTHTHGTSVQRMRWFNIGYKSGNKSSCKTEGMRNL